MSCGGVAEAKRKEIPEIEGIDSLSFPRHRCIIGIHPVHRLVWPSSIPLLASQPDPINPPYLARKPRLRERHSLAPPMLLLIRSPPPQPKSRHAIDVFKVSFGVVPCPFPFRPPISLSSSLLAISVENCGISNHYIHRYASLLTAAMANPPSGGAGGFPFTCANGP